MKYFLVCIIGMTATVQLAFAASVSSPTQQSASAAGNSFNPAFSADGQHLVFVSHANNLVVNDDLGLWLDVFVRDLVTSNTVLVSVSSNGVGGANADANYPSVSSNGQFIAFASRASNLVPGDTNDAVDIFVRDVVAGTTHLVSTDMSGSVPADPNPSSVIPLFGNPMISADGRYVIFESRATSLTPDSVTVGDVYLYRRDLWSNDTRRASQSLNMAPGSTRHELGGITPGAEYAIYTSKTNNSQNTDVFLHDPNGIVGLQPSQDVAKFITNGGYRCSSPVLGGTWYYSAFHTTPLNGGPSLVLYHNSLIQTTRVVSVAATNLGHGLSISANGRFVLYEEMDGAFSRVRLWDAQLNSSAFISCGGDDSRGNPAMNTAATAFAYVGCSNIFTTGTNTLGVSVRASVSTNGGASAGNYQFSTPAISANGARVAFAVNADDLVSGDLNGASDVFLRDVNAGVTELITKAHPAKPAATSFAHSFLGPNSVSADGRFIVSTRYDDPSAYRDTNNWPDVFVSDASSGTSVAVSINSNLYSTNLESGGTVGPPGYLVENTNSYATPIISADGSTVVAMRPRSSTGQGYSYVTLARASNGVFSSSGMSVQSRGIFASVADSPALSGDGLLLAFRSDGNDLNPDVNDANNASDVWLRYYFLGSNGLFFPTNYLLGLSTDNYNSGNGPSLAPSLSGDGGTVVFGTKAGNLLPTTTGGANGQYANYQIVAALAGTNRNDTNYLAKIPKRLCSYTISFQQYSWLDAANTNIHHTNLNAILTPVPVDTSNAVFSANNRFVVYSHADGSAIWRHDLRATQSNYTFVSYAPYPNDYGSIVATNIVPGATNLPVCTNCRNPSVSADGNIVAYERVRAGSSLVDLFAKDLRNGGETLVSGNVANTPANGSSTTPLISGDGRYVTFQSQASDLVANDTNGMNDVFVRDRLLGVTMLVSANAPGRAGNGPSTKPVLAADGRTVVFQSFASDLAAGDFNDKRDVFVLKLGGTDTDGDGMDDDWEMAYFNTLSRNGTADFDGDGVSDKAEFLAGTDPTNANSVFRVLTLAPAGGGGKLLLWSGNPARSYRAEFKDDLGAANWTALSGTISWNGPTASIPDPNAGSTTNRYYRVVRLP